jgi:MscS family membrane protein
MRRAVLLLVLLGALTFVPAWAPAQRAAGEPARTVERFLALVRQDRLEEAEPLVDFGRIPAERRAAALRAMAECLVESALDPDRIEPPAEEGLPLILSRVQDDRGEALGRIAIRQMSGRWRFTAESAEAAPAMAAEIARRRQAAARADAAAIGAASQTAASAAGLASPRQAMETFLTAMTNGDLAEAAGVLSLDHINPVIRPVRGQELAARLSAILNRTEFIQLDAIPSAPSGSDWLIAAFSSRSGLPVGDIRLSRGSDGAWRFPQRTVESLDAIWSEVRERPLIAGLRDRAFESDASARMVRGLFPESWSRRIAGMQAWQAASLAILLGLGIGIGFLAKIVIRALIRPRLEKLETRFRQDELRRITRGLAVMSGLIMVLSGLGLLGLPSTALAVLRFILEGALAAAITFTAWSAWTGVVNLFSGFINSDQSRSRSLFVRLLHSIGRTLIVGGVLIYLGIRLGVNVAGIIAGLGIGGAILALAAKDSVENFFGSITILLEAPFGLGDWIKVDDEEGVVEEITLRSTHIRTFSDSLLVMPNSKIITGTVENFGQRRRRSFKARLPLAYGSDPLGAVEFCRRCREALAKRDDLWEESIHVHLHGFSDLGVEALVQLFIIAPDWTEELRIREEVMQTVLSIAHDSGVTFAVSPEAIEPLFRRAAEGGR